MEFQQAIEQHSKGLYEEMRNDLGFKVHVLFTL